MKKTYIIISAIAALALTSACTLKTDFPPMAGEDVITLDLLCAEPGVKSAGVGKENAINTVEYFFYTDTTEAPVFAKWDPSPSGKITGNTYTISLTAGKDGVPPRTELFKDGKFEVYAVFNATDSIAAKKLAMVKETAVGLTFAHKETDGWVVTLDDDSQNREKYFVMTGQKTINKANGGSYANVEAEKTVDMRRIAAKVEVNLKVQAVKGLTDGTTWSPMLGADNVRLYMCNFVQNSLLSAADTLNTILPATYTQADYKVYTLDTDDLEPASGYYDIASQQVFYTYPIEWEAGADNEPYLKLIIPWAEKDGTVPNKELYYKIMFPPSITSLEANKHYILDVTVDLLGNEGEPTVTIKGYNAQVVGWSENGKVNSSVAAATFLSVERDSTEYYTENSGISFVASEMVYLEITNVYQKNLNTGDNEYVVEDGELSSDRTDLGTPAFIYDSSNRVIGLKLTDEGVTTNWIELSNDNSYLEVGHQLDADLTSEHMDVTPWVYEITMKLVGVDDEAGYNRDVVFEQCPNVYVREDANSAYAESSGHNNSRGYVYVNGQTQSNSGWNEVSGWSTGGNTNSNQYMYVITIAVSNKYQISDPRTTAVNNLGWTNNWGQAPWTEQSGNHRLQFYHPAERTGTSNYIAPKIRIASSYGKAGQMSKENARRRCAAYQEDGIPAGRWRLPTFAEVEFIATLSSLGRIPILFSDATTTNGDYYWIANGNSDTTGAALVDNVGSDKGVTEAPNRTNNSYVRCVYDEWFWGDAIETRPVTKSTFTWGDRNYQ